MVLTGILNNSLNGQLCLRGFAKIKDLARVSKADYTYQRNPIDRSDISDFLETQSYLFFPEVILGYKIIPIGKESVVKLIQEGKKAKSREGSFSVKKINGESERFVTIELNETINPQPFSRIDGNHRLMAAEKSSNPKVENMVAPYCLILGENSTEFDKATKVFFHNINTKTIPLTSEENLKVLIDDDVNFSNDELIDIFGGKHPIKTRDLIKKAKPELFGNIQHIIRNNYRTYLNNTFKHLLKDGEDENTVVDKVVNSLQAINTLYGSEPKLKSNNSIGILTAFLYYHVKDESSKFDMFRKWILNNQIFNIKEVSTISLIRIFDEIISSEIKVFVAMPYFDEQVIADYNKIYSETINQIANDFSINISLFPIMCNKGATQDQIQDIINKINECKICFADITGNNANVSYEMGWARALKKDVIIVKRKNSDTPKSDYVNDTYHDYNDSARSVDLAKIIRENIIEVLEKNYGLIKR